MVMFSSFGETGQEEIIYWSSLLSSDIIKRQGQTTTHITPQSSLYKYGLINDIDLVNLIVTLSSVLFWSQGLIWGCRWAGLGCVSVWLWHCVLCINLYNLCNPALIWQLYGSIIKLVQLTLGLLIPQSSNARDLWSSGLISLPAKLFFTDRLVLQVKIYFLLSD